MDWLHIFNMTIENVRLDEIHHTQMRTMINKPREIREVKISIISKFSAIPQIVELGLFTLTLSNVTEIRGELS